MYPTILFSDGNSLIRSAQKAEPCIDLEKSEFSSGLRTLAHGLVLAAVVLPKLAIVGAGVHLLADASDAVTAAAA